MPPYTHYLVKSFSRPFSALNTAYGVGGRGPREYQKRKHKAQVPTRANPYRHRSVLLHLHSSHEVSFLYSAQLQVGCGYAVDRTRYAQFFDEYI